MNEDFVDKRNKTYTLTDKGKQDFKTLIEALNCYVKLIIQEKMTLYPECPELRACFENCENLNETFYRDAIRDLNLVNNHIFRLAKKEFLKGKSSFEKALNSICYSIEDELDKLLKGICGKR